jgi:hypothetical protein
MPVCTARQALRCNGDDLVSCNDDGSAELTVRCALGCHGTELRCNDIDPSNGLAGALDMAIGEPDLDLGTTATINTDDGTLTVGGNPAVVKSVAVSQGAAPTIRVFIVHGLTAGDVTVTGTSALAIVSDGDIKIAGNLTASASATRNGAGAVGKSCGGGEGTLVSGGAVGGSGGGGFGTAGARGGSATNVNGTAQPGAAGAANGNTTLVPLRGGCSSGNAAGAGNDDDRGGAGGAIQLVSRTKIRISGVVAASGSSIYGGGSGGGILLEAPSIDVLGNVVANGGGGGGGCLLAGARPGDNGHLDASPALGGQPCDATNGAAGGNGDAGGNGARTGASINVAGSAGRIAFAGGGGGGGGRIRVNSVPGGLNATGIFSPSASTGTVGVR